MMVNALNGFATGLLDSEEGTYVVSSGTDSFIVSDGVSEIYITGTGGGAGGGSQCGANPGGNQYRSGGGGGGSIHYRLSVSPGDVIAITVGEGGAVACGSVGNAGYPGGDTTISVNGGVALTLGGAPSYIGGSGPLTGGASSGYFGTPGYSGAQASSLIGTTYGAGGWGTSDNYPISYGSRGYVQAKWLDSSNHRQYSPGATTLVVPAGVTSMRAYIVAGGGGSAYSGNNITFGAGCGGGGGGWAGAISVTPGETLSITVGSGGARAYDDQYGGTMTGSTGGSSSLAGGFGTITATGGSGGYATPSTSTGGAGGTCATATTPYTGGTGATGASSAGGAGALSSAYNHSAGAGGSYTQNGTNGMILLIW